MKRISLSIVVLICFFEATAQQEYYIFIQEPSRQPFYVRMGQESHSSSAEGHIILAKLKDSVYNLYVGFPKLRDEELFTVTINKKDHGYELRGVNGRRQMFDLVTLQTINPVATTLSDGQTIRKTDSYSELMAGVVDDSAVLFTSPADTLTSDTALASGKMDSGSAAKPVAAKVKSKKKKAAAGAFTDTIAVKKEVPLTVVDSIVARIDGTDTAEVKTDNAAPAQVAVATRLDSSVRDKRDIIRLSTENIVEGKLIIYVDRTGSSNDTIRIIIPKSL